MAQRNIFRSRKERPNASGNAGNGGEPAAPPAPSGETQGSPDGRPSLPPFYVAPTPVHGALHGGKGIKKNPDYRFASGAHAVGLQLSEFRAAAVHYPIVFAEEQSALPMALLGYRKDQNLFVEPDGAWAPGAYVPAYVRRYPFAVGKGTRGDEEILYLDVASDLVVDLDGGAPAEPLFLDAAPSDYTERMRAFCAAFQAEIVLTAAFADALKALHLLASKEIKLQFPDGELRVLNGLRLVEQDSFDRLPDEAVLEWRRKGWLAAVYWHWASLDNLRRMMRRGGG